MALKADRARNQLNLQVLTLLTAGRIYTERLEAEISSKRTLTEAAASQLDVLRRKIYDECVEYRIVYCLRNFSVHNQLPIGSIKFKIDSFGRTRDEIIKSHRRLTLNPEILILGLLKAEQMKKVKPDLERIGLDKLDLKNLIRAYVSKVAELHQKLRGLTENILRNELELISTLTRGNFEGYVPEYPAQRIRIQNSAGETVSEKFIDPRRLDMILAARKKWCALTGASSSFCSNEVVDRLDAFTGERDHE